MKKTIALATFLAALSGTTLAADGAAVFEKACKACHGAGVAGAPKAHDAAAWSERKAKGMDELLKSVKNGKSIMPAGGNCAGCSDDDYKAAIEFMSK